MAKRKQEIEIVGPDQIPPDAIGAVVLADLAQIVADAKTHPNLDARRRILFAADRLQQIAIGEMSPAVVNAVKRSAEAMHKMNPIKA